MASFCGMWHLTHIELGLIILSDLIQIPPHESMEAKLLHAARSCNYIEQERVSNKTLR